MPCNKCGHFLILREEELICPKCNDMQILDSVTASIISCKRVQYFKELWKTELVKANRPTFLLHIADHREHTCREFFKKYSLIELGKYFSDTLFLKRVIKLSNPQGGQIIDDKTTSAPFIDLFNETIRVEVDNLLINSCYANMLYSKEFELDSISGEDALSNFIITQNEMYLDLFESYANYGIFTQQEGEAKIKESMEEFERIMQKNEPKSILTRQEFVERNYDIISSLYMSLLRNELFAEVFELRDYGEILTDPSDLMKFINQFPYDIRGLTTCDTVDFLKRLKDFFNKDEDTLRKIFLFENTNPDCFPLFIRFQHEKRDFVIISQAFTIFVYILLHAILTRSLFIRETEKRAKKFESVVKETFENLGFTYHPNFTYVENKKKIEIDGLAVKNDVCYVVECKKPRLPLLVESNEARKIMIEDLKGIVDGFKRIPRNGERAIIDRPSLPCKIDYVKINKNSLPINLQGVSKIIGIVITMDNPFLESYKGIKFLPLNKITNSSFG